VNLSSKLQAFKVSSFKKKHLKNTSVTTTFDIIKWETEKTMKIGFFFLAHNIYIYAY